ncbi:hypothetical protein Tco_1229093 [Tanacetum coccineum]
MPELTSHGGHGRDYESHGIDDEGYSIESDRLSLEEEEEAVTRSASSVSSVRDGLGGLIAIIQYEWRFRPAQFERYPVLGFGVRAESVASNIQSDMEASGENRDLWLQLAEERRARLELAEVVDGTRRGQEPRGGV